MSQQISDMERLRALMELKAKLLSFGVTITEDALQQVGSLYKENNYGYNNPNRMEKGTDKSHFLDLPQEMIIPGNMVVSVRHRTNSPYRVSAANQSHELSLTTPDGDIYPILFTPRPKFWAKETSRGTPMKRIGSLYGLNTLTYFVRNHCEFFDIGAQCHFCGIVSSYRALTTVEFEKDLADMEEVLNEALKEDPIDFINFIGGSYLDFDKEARNYIKVIQHLSQRCHLPRINGNVISMPPKDFNLINALYDAGIEYAKFNLEIYDPVLFERICSGKARLYGRDAFLKALEYAVSIFGPGKVYTNLIVGLEPRESFITGCRHLASLGVVPEGISFHPDLGTPLAKAASASPIAIEEAGQVIAEICYEFGYKPWLNRGSLRGSLSWESYDLQAVK